MMNHKGINKNKALANDVVEAACLDPSEFFQCTSVASVQKGCKDLWEWLGNKNVMLSGNARESRIMVFKTAKVGKITIFLLLKEYFDCLKRAHKETRAALANSEQQATTAHAPAASPALDVPASSSHVAESNNIQESEADGYSIYIKNLPLNATPPQLEEEFKKFGPIKPNGIQVRSNKLQGFCFGFVEFEVASSVQSAIEASPILIGGRQAYVEEKRTSGSRANSRGRFAPGRGGGFRGDGRGHAFYGGGRGYGRSDYNNGTNFGSRGGRTGA
ncbi:hypothetical protein HPP92_023863 [Vanilla planifolia]|uniref:RRM domain-containing protein n=1 Tax=Vanilla planifolia TaxID=51239 RepID=A0A835PP82_VANPL|nr:hypothetical protein HPP92_023863 [Vanilla planifolia]